LSTIIHIELKSKNGSESGLRGAVSYRFGFNGKENDNEVKGTGNQQDYGMRIYDPRLARFLSADPLIVKEQKYAELSPYQFASNTPIMYIDIDGLEGGKPTTTDNSGRVTLAQTEQLYGASQQHQSTLQQRFGLIGQIKINQNKAEEPRMPINSIQPSQKKQFAK